MTSQINWKKGDYISLGRAVSQFNKKIKSLEGLKDKSYLPNEIVYKDIKETILSRNELKRVINSLRRFQKEGAENLYITQAGQKMTEWERNELGILKRSATRKIQSEIEQLNEPIYSGISRVQMGSFKEKQLRATLENLQKLELLRGYDFKLLKERLLNIGSSDYDLKKAIVYKENYLKELEKYKSFENYDKLIDKIKNLSPKRFYEFMKKTEFTKDLTYVSDTYFSQNEFNYFLEDLGIEIDENTDEIEKDLYNFKYETKRGNQVIF